MIRIFLLKIVPFMR